MKKTKLEKGITLIALIITIVILLILAVVTLGALEDSKIIDHAYNASSEYAIAQEKEQIALGYSEYILDSIKDPNAKLKVDGATVSEDGKGGWKVTFESGNTYPVQPNGTIGSQEDKPEIKPVVNPNPTDWTIAYAYDGTEWTKYTEEDQAVGGSAEGGVLEGQIVAKFYKQNVPTVETSINADPGEEYLDPRIITVPAKDFSYKLYIEGSGSGQMPAMSDGETVAYGYQVEFLASVATLNAEDALMPYVTDVMICDGVKNIGAFAFAGGVNINNLQISNTVEAIDSHAFVFCKIPELNIPSTVSTIGDHAFHATILNNVEIPEGVVEIEAAAFSYSSMKKLIIPSTVRKVNSYAFGSCQLLKEVYIYTEECEFAVYCFSDMYKSRGENEEKGKIYVKNIDYENKIGTPGGDYEFVEF